MSATPKPRRHALGLPGGSVRALLSLVVLGLLWLLYWQYPEKLPPTFVYLLFLMILILVHYFAAHGKNLGTPGERHALGLPRGTVRLILVIGFGVLIGFLFQTAPKVDLPEGMKLIRLVGLLLGGFLGGYVLDGLVKTVHGGEQPFWFQDVEAWLAIVATVALSLLVLIYGIINPSLQEAAPMDVGMLESVAAGLVGFYFGARS